MYRRAISRRTLAAPLALLVVLAAMTLWLSINHYRNTMASRNWVVHSHEVIEAAQGLFSKVQDVESAARGVMVDGDLQYIDRFDADMRDIPPLGGALVALVRDNAPQTERAELLVATLNERTAIAARRIALIRAGDLPAARAIGNGVGKRVMDRARGMTDNLIAEEKRLLAERTAEAADDERTGIFIILTVTSAASLGLAFLILALFRMNRGLGLEIRAREESDTARARDTQLHQAVFDHAGDYLFVLSVAPDGVLAITHMNPAYEKAMGVPFARVRDRDLRDIIANGAELAADYSRIIATGEPGVIRQELPLRTGLRVWESTVVPVVNAQGRVDRIVGAARDITDREIAEAQARSAQKMEAIGHLTGGVAHDFNNLLQVVRGNLELIAPALRHDEQAAQRLKSALHGADRAAQLTRQLLAFARRQPLEPRVVNLGRLVSDMTDLLRRTLSDQVEVETVVAGGLWNTLADPAQVESAVLNLAINARDAMPGGGRLTVELSNASLDEAYAARAGGDIKPGQYVMLAISDTGHGMSAETLARVFEPFFTTKAVDKGTGLGLSMVYGFVKQSNGHVQAYSEVGEGTTIRIYLPRSRKAEEAAAPAPPPPVQGRSEVILVVEDEDLVRSTAVGMLRDMGYTCLHASDAGEALKVFESGAKIDLLFTDVIMPGKLKSRELANEAQKIRPGLPVLFTSGYTANAIVHQGRLDEGVNLLSKPYQKDDLARRVRSLLDAARPVVLVVEDEPLVRMAAVDMIEDLGFVVVETDDAPGALKALESGDRIDILFTDIGLPTMRGGELAARAAALRPGLKIIFASGFGEGVNPEQASGAIYLSKPYDQDDLARALRS